MNRLLVPVAGLAALTLLSACGGSSHTASPTAVSPGAPTTSSVPATTAPTSTAPASTAPASTSPTTTTPPPTAAPTTYAAPTSTVPPTTAPATSTTVGAGGACQNGQIEVTALTFGEAAGQVNQVLGFVNTSNTTCTLAGYPGVAALDATGAQVIQAQRDTTQVGGSTVILAPGQTASAAVSGLDNPQGTATSCPYYPSLLVTPPNLTQSVTVTITGEGNIAGFPGCDGLLIAPVVAGTTGGLN